MSHAQAGEKWIRKYLADKGKTEEQLAATLWEKNWTAIAEVSRLHSRLPGLETHFYGQLCDDSFEEHVLAYPPEKTGLHLHGINESAKHFKTLSHTQVDAFAEEWGFIKTPSIILQSIPEVKAFTSEVAKTGKWNGDAVEGFVVRTHVAETPVRSSSADKANSTNPPPYSPGASFFFKVKFDEPYMMYRDWREITKSLLSAKDLLSDARLPKSKMKRPETRVYAQWVVRRIQEDRKPFAQYANGKGILRTRESFLMWLETEEGREALGRAKANNVEGGRSVVTGEFGKTIIVPVAIPGVGMLSEYARFIHSLTFG